MEGFVTKEHIMQLEDNKGRMSSSHSSDSLDFKVQVKPPQLNSNDLDESTIYYWRYKYISVHKTDEELE